MLNSSAIQNPLTEKPEINSSAIKIIRAFMTSRKSPKVTMVMGMVKIIKIGFTIAFNKASTTATIIAEPYPLTPTPGSR